LKLSIVIPSIRSTLIPAMLDSLAQSCTKYEYEVILVGPNFSVYDKTICVIDYGTPSRATQIGLLYCSGELYFNAVDDALFLPGAIDNAIEQYDNMCGNLDVILMRYRESPGRTGKEAPIENWNAWYHEALRLPGIDPGWKICGHTLLSLATIKQFGGYDCRFEHINYNIHDLLFRIQRAGGNCYPSNTEISNDDHMPGHSGDHAAICLSDGPDQLLFRSIYGSELTAKQRPQCIDLYNWKQSPAIWERRFKV